MNLSIVLGDRLNVTVPVHLFSCNFPHVSHLLSLLGRGLRSGLHVVLLGEGSIESLGKIHRVDLCSQERNLRLLVHSFLYVIDNLKLVARLLH